MSSKPGSTPSKQKSSINQPLDEHSEPIKPQLPQSEELFSKAFQSTPAALILARVSDRRIQYANESFLELVGYRRQEVIGQIPAQIGAFPNPKQIEEFRRLLAETNHVRNLETDIRTKSGEIKTVLFSVDIIEVNAEPHTLSTMIDITPRKLAEKQVLQMKRLYATLSQVNQTIVRVQSDEELYRSICDIALKFGELTFAWVGLLNEETGDLQPVAASGMGVDIKQWPLPIINIYARPPINGVIAEAITTSSPVTSTDVQVDERTRGLRDVIQPFGFHSLAAVPFRLREKTIGVLVMISVEIGIFEAEAERSLLTEMGLDISFALETMENEKERRQAEQKLSESRALFQMLFHSSPVAYVLSRTSDRTVVDINPAGEEFLGYSRAEIVGKQPTDIDYWADPADRQRATEKFWQDGKLRGHEFSYKTKAGAIGWAIGYADMFEQGGETYVLTELIDISQRRQAEAELRYQAHLLENVNDAIVASDENFNITAWNAAAERMYGWKAKEVLGKRGVDLFQTQFAAEANADEMRKQIATSGRFVGEATQRRKDGTRIHVEAASIVLRDDAGEIIGYVSVNRDISKRKQAEDELRTLNARLEEIVARRTEELNRANRAKDEFMASMSHELRTPLNSILGLSETLLEQRRGTLNQSQQNAVQSIETSGQHLLALINDILDVSKIETGKLELVPETVLVDEICTSSLAFIRTQALKKSITVSYRNESAFAQIIADSRRLKQILVNLLTNAVKFTPDQGHVTLSVSTSLEQDTIQFSVADTGIGISAEDLKKIFQPFVQVDRHLNRPQEGTGLGLALVQKLTDLHGGSVHVESEVGKGSRFTVNLRCSAESVTESDAANVQYPVTAGQEAVSDAVPTPSLDRTGIILLAEDTPSNVMTICEYLESFHYDVIVVTNGAEALQKVEEVQPDVILMDIQMPVMDGLETISRLRKDPRFTNTPIVALTALAMAGDRERCLAAGATEYLSKPVRLKNLVTLIENLMKPDL